MSYIIICTFILFLQGCTNDLHFTIIFQDFGDGAAFPEIQVAQYPLDMGRKKKTSNALSLQFDAQGKVKYDAIAKQGHAKDKVFN